MTAAIANNEALVPPRRWATRTVALNSSSIPLIFRESRLPALPARRRVHSRRVGLPSSMMAPVNRRASLPALVNKQEVG